MPHGPNHTTNYATETCLEWGLVKKFHINYNQGSINQIPCLLDPYQPICPMTKICVQLMVTFPRVGPPSVIEFHSIDNNVWRKTLFHFVQCCTTLLSTVSCRSLAHFLWDTKYFVTFYTRNQFYGSWTKRKHGFKTKRIPKEKSSIATHLGTQQSGKILVLYLYLNWNIV